MKEQQATIEKQKAALDAQQKVITANTDDISFLKQYTKQLEAKITNALSDKPTLGNK